MDPRWRRLGVRIAAERVRLGYLTLPAFAKVSGLSRTTLDSLEHGRKQRYDPGTLARLEHALRWEAGSVDRVLRGLEPDRTVDPDLAAVLDSWPRLSVDARRMLRILATEAAKVS